MGSSPNPVTNVWDSSMTDGACHRYTKWNYDNRCTALASGKYADLPGGAKRENGLFKKVDTNQIFDGITGKLKECEDFTIGEPVVNCYTGPTDCPQPCDCATSAWQSAPTKWQAWEVEEPKPAPHMTCDGQPDKPACDSFFGQGTDGSFATLVDTSIQGGPAPGEGPGESNFCRMNGMEPPCTIIHYVGPESNECSSPNPVTNVWDYSMTDGACHRYTKWNYDERCTALASGKYADLPGGAKREKGLYKKVDTNQIFDGYTGKLKECEDFTVGEPVVNCYTGPTDCPQPCDCATSAWQSAETESGGDEDVGDGDGEGLTCFVPNDTSFDVSITCSDIAVRSVGCYSDNDCGTGSTCSFER